MLLPSEKNVSIIELSTQSTSQGRRRTSYMSAREALKWTSVDFSQKAIKWCASSKGANQARKMMMWKSGKENLILQSDEENFYGYTQETPQEVKQSKLFGSHWVKKGLECAAWISCLGALGSSLGLLIWDETIRSLECFDMNEVIRKPLL